MLDEGKMFWDEVVTGNKQNVRLRSESERDSIESVVVAKKTKTDGVTGP